MKILPYLFLGMIGSTLWTSPLSAQQVTIRGTIYDKTMINALPDVSISNTHGAIAMSDSVGHFSIKLDLEDTLFFSYLKKQTTAFPVRDIPNRNDLNVSIDVVGPAMLPFYVSHNTYQADSLLNRLENKAGFDYQKSSSINNIRMMPGGQGFMGGVSLDFDMFFNHKLNKSREIMHKWLIEQEQDKYVDHRFNRSVVKRVTGLDSADLKLFMQLYRPSYEFLKSFASDWDYYQYILDYSKLFRIDHKKDSAGISTINTGANKTTTDHDH